MILVCTGGTPTTIDNCINLCGNGKRDFMEECDDNNSNPGDGCSYCTVDYGYTCSGGSPTTADTCQKKVIYRFIIIIMIKTNLISNFLKFAKKSIKKLLNSTNNIFSE